MQTLDAYRMRLAGIVVLSILLTCVSAQEEAPHEPGVVYYSDGSIFKPLRKEAAPASGRARFSAKLKGAHADVRLAAAQTLKFRLCSADPTRYKLYRLQSTRNSRDVTITKINLWIGGAKSTLSESETSPSGEEYAFAFGVGDVRKFK